LTGEKAGGARKQRGGGHCLGGMPGYVMLVAGAHSDLHRVVLLDGVCVCVFLCVCVGGGGREVTPASKIALQWSVQDL
jgi:hypothetical protein